MSLRRNGLLSSSLGQEVLVGVLPRKGDVAILERENWYRVPVEKAPRRWPPSWVAFYEGSRVGGLGTVRRYARVAQIEKKTREELFPGEPAGRRAGRLYYRVLVEDLQELPLPVPLGRPRPVVFISTTLAKLRTAESISDLFGR